MKKLFVALLVVTSSLPAMAVNVRAEDQEQSLAEAAKLHFMCMVIGCDENGTPVEFRGTGSLIVNTSKDSFALIADHSIRNPGATENRCPKWLLYFEPPIVEGWNYNEIEVTQIFHYELQDIALLKLNGPVTMPDGSLIPPIDLYEGPLDDGATIKFGGYGVSVEPSLSDPSLTTPLDYKRRVARGRLLHPLVVDPTLLYLEYDESLILPGIGAYCDSGGFAAIESGDALLMVGLMKNGRGLSTESWTGFEYFQYDDGSGQLFLHWLEETIAANSEDQNTAPVADTGTGQTVHIGQTVTLNGSESSDADNDALSYSWAMVSAPEGSGAVLSDASAVAPTFVADAVGEFVFQLVVNDGTEDSEPATVTVTVTGSRYDVNADGSVDAVDIQLVINGALGLPTAYTCDVNDDVAVDALDIQLVINAALGLLN